jgi:uncharacterized membrane protein YbhN (UPF0104 family)
MEQTTVQKPVLMNRLKLLFKIVVTIGCLWYVFTKINFREAWSVIITANWFWLLSALVIYSVSKYIGARRLSIYFKNIGIYLPESQNVKLYWLGMFYNLFLPGAITGDAYKVVLLTRRYQTSYKKTAAAVLLDRFSGLLALGLILAFYSCFVVKEKWILFIIIFSSLLSIPVFYFVLRRFFSDFLPGYWPTFFLGALVQITIVICVYSVLLSIHVREDYFSFVFIFLIATIASVLPISVGGGLGVREFVIIEGAKHIGLNIQGQHNALVLSLLFYLITVICSLAGVYFVVRDPFDKKPVN